MKIINHQDSFGSLLAASHLTVVLILTRLPAMVILAYLILCLIWGSTWMAIKIGIADAPPFYMAGIRFMLSVALLGSIALVRRFSYPRSIKALVSLGYPGLYMYGVSYAFVYLAEGYIDSSLTAVLFGSFPFFVAMLSSLRLADAPRINLMGWLGLLVGFSGVVLISYAQWEKSNEMLLGSIMVLLASFAAAWGIIIHKRKFTEVNIVVSTSVQMLFGGLPLLLLAIVVEDFSQFEFTQAAIGSIIYLALFGSVIAFLLYYWLIRKTTVLLVSLIAFVTPLVAIIFGLFFMDELLTWQTALGTVLILSGILTVIKRKPKG